MSDEYCIKLHMHIRAEDAKDALACAARVIAAAAKCRNEGEIHELLANASLSKAVLDVEAIEVLH